MASSNQGSQSMSFASHTSAREGKTIEQIYQKKTQLEHILLRPDTYVGSTEMQTQDLWIFDAVQSRMALRRISYVPALYKIFDEILVNAADNLIRDPVGMDTIRVDIDKAAGSLSVFNNGKGLPVVVHKEHKVYIPEMVFGHLLSSDNYNDNDAKVVGGRNGYGAKLANVFSSEFIIETADGSKRFRQTFRNNMTEKSRPEVVESKQASFTRVTFKPDLKRFGMEEFDEAIVSLFMKRVYDIAGSTAEKCNVFLNGESLDVHTFRDYSDLYLLTRPGYPQIYEQCSERWEVCVSLTEGGFQQVSFVNSIATIRGGTHVAHVTDQIVGAVLEKAKVEGKEKMKGGIDVRAHHVKHYLWVFVRCLIENPAFDSQTKETLMTKPSKFGSSCELSSEFLEKVSSCGIVGLIVTAAMAKTKVDLAKKLRANTGRVTRLLGVPKLEDANDAGGKHSAECTLILTEGDSAKALAVAGLGVVGRDRYGVFPLRGKVLNVRDATLKQMMNNEEIQNLIKILGLDWNREYDAELKGLRYGSIMIMTDQDHDGSHIKGLLINLVHAWWPSLAKVPGFLKEFFTPIVKAKRGSKRALSFYTMPEYEKWKTENDNGKGWNIKYYKGLGTSTPLEAKEYFSAISSHRLSYRYDGPVDDGAIDMAFNKKRADDRKVWINSYDGDLIDHTADAEVSYSDFINKELVLFSQANVTRSIPSVVDGFKPSQRKVLFGCFKRKLKKDLKVAQLVGYVSEHVAYHHGESALTDTIIAMAQDFVGSNNLNLLVPQGQFGTRLQGGKDVAAARYIYTRLAPVARALFPESDDKVLDYLNEEGLSIEPRYYCPIIPMVLVNGVDGIGTGWSSFIPNYNPRDIIANLRKLINDEPMMDMLPWYAGFKGNIKRSGADKCEVTGIIKDTGPNTASITELPVRKWTQDYREFLEDNLVRGDRRRGAGDSSKLLEEYQEFHTEQSVHFDLSLSPEGIKGIANGTLLQTFKLRTTLSLNNMVLFNHEGKIHKYESVLEIMNEFAEVRLAMYADRKKYLIQKLTHAAEVLSAKARFVQMVIRGELIIKRRKILDLVADMRSKGFQAWNELQGAGRGTGGARGGGAGDHGPDDGEDKNAEEDEIEEEERASENEMDGDNGSGDEAEDGEGATSARKLQKKAVADFEYLVGMPISTLTAERVQELLQQRDTTLSELEATRNKSLEAMWWEDLDALEKVLDEREQDREKEHHHEAASSGSKGKAAADSKDKPPASPGRRLRSKRAASPVQAPPAAPPMSEPAQAHTGGRSRKRVASGPAQGSVAPRIQRAKASS